MFLQIAFSLHFGVHCRATAVKSIRVKTLTEISYNSQVRNLEINKPKIKVKEHISVSIAETYPDKYLLFDLIEDLMEQKPVIELHTM